MVQLIKMLPFIHQVANEYKANLQNLYGNELAEVILFGSYARGDNHYAKPGTFFKIVKPVDFDGIGR